MTNLIKRCLGSIVVGLGVLLLIAAAWYAYNLRPASQLTENKLVRIESGSSVGEIATTLKAKGVIRNRLAFMIYLYSRGVAGRIQAGIYELQPAYTVARATDILTSGETVTKVVTIVSGQRLDQISKELQKKGFTKAEVNQALKLDYTHHPVLKDKPKDLSLEGYLYPDSYHIDVDSSVEDVINLVLDNLEDKLTPPIRETWQKQGLNIHEGLTMASIIQKEVASSVEQQMVASVFFNRLERNIKLETDPTYQYAAILMGVVPSIHIDSPYNTYRYKGLPPGPIGASGQSAIEAVASPQRGDYLFFVTGKDGKTRFSRTQDQHEALIKRFGVHQ